MSLLGKMKLLTLALALVGFLFIAKVNGGGDSISESSLISSDGSSIPGKKNLNT